MLFFAKFTDDILVAGNFSLIELFMDKLHARFLLRKRVVDERFNFNGDFIELHLTGSMSIKISDCLGKIKPISLTRERRKKIEHAVTQ